MGKSYNRTHNFKLPKKEEINSTFAAFNKKERIIFALLVIILLISTLSILETINRSLMVKVPLHAGEISEGIIGTPRFVNPLLANTPADQDMVALVYSGLMRKNTDGTLTPDLAKSYTMSENGLTYTFTLKDKIYFQNGKPVTADDVIFTVNEAKDPTIKSPQEIDWSGVTATKINAKTIQFSLKQPYPSFLENTTLGIMPEALWANSPIELNTANINPIGSGPYMVANVNEESSGVIDSYKLSSFKKFTLGEPYISTMNVYFYPNEDNLISALEDGTVDQISSISPLNADILKERNYQVESSVLPRVFGLFFNQNQNRLFTDKVITSSIDQAIDKDKIVQQVLFGYGDVIDNPIPPNLIAYQEQPSINNLSRDQVLQNIQNNLAKDGWVKGSDGFLQKNASVKSTKATTKTSTKAGTKKSAKGKTKTTTTTTTTVTPTPTPTTTAATSTPTELEFSISTGNAPELAETAELIKEDLAQIGMKVDIKTFDVGNLNQSVIRPRDYDALLFGEIINHESDLYAFWHSSQRKDPGLNVAMYTNAKVDKILEDASTNIDEQSRIKEYAQFESDIRSDIPAVFLYSPNFIYVVSPNVQGLSIDHIISPSDRFANVYSWYTETQNVWRIFTPTH
jgi:peptide/nickel transport system substrate-binding protein